MPPPIPPSGFDDNYYSQAGCEYFDGDDVPSDPEDDAAFDYNWADVPASDEPAADICKRKVTPFWVPRPGKSWVRT
jgi:hypothetical protein